MKFSPRQLAHLLSIVNKFSDPDQYVISKLFSFHKFGYSGPSPQQEEKPDILKAIQSIEELQTFRFPGQFAKYMNSHLYVSSEKGEIFAKKICIQVPKIILSLFVEEERSDIVHQILGPKNCPEVPVVLEINQVFSL